MEKFRCNQSLENYELGRSEIFYSVWSNAKFLQICSDEETNSSTVHIGLPGVSKYSENFHFGVNYSINQYIFFWHKPNCYLIQVNKAFIHFIIYLFLPLNFNI